MMDAALSKWITSRQRKALVAGAGKANGQAVSVTARTKEQQAEIDRRKALYEACFAAARENRGRVTFARADALAEQVGVGEATRLIETFGEGAFIEAVGARYWRTH